MPDWTDRAARRMYEGAGLGPKDVDIFNPYDGYAPMAQFFLEAFQWHGVKRGDAFAFYAGDIRVEGPHPFCSSGGNLGNGRTRTAMYTDSIEQLRGTAAARQVRVRADGAGFGKSALLKFVLFLWAAVGIKGCSIIIKQHCTCSAIDYEVGLGANHQRIGRGGWKP